MLIFARELKDLLLRDGNFIVVLTREEDEFVRWRRGFRLRGRRGRMCSCRCMPMPLPRVRRWVLRFTPVSAEASDAAAQALAERHDRADLLSGVDLTAQDDLVATILMDMARTETEPRIERLALSLEGRIKEAGIRMHRHPRQTAGFSVLKSPDIPSVLLELGFMSSAQDLARLIDPEWRSRMALALRDGLKLWAAEDAALSAMRR